MTDLLDHAQLETALDWDALIAELRNWFIRNAVEAPPRQVLSMPQPDGSEASLLIMLAWVPGQSIGVKVVTFFPENAQHGRPTINAGYMLFDGATGQMRAVMDGDVLTARRTAAASALAADYLARKDAARLLIVGTGQLSRSLAMAHARQRDYSEIAIWGRNRDSATHVAQDLCDAGLPARATDTLDAACASACVISAATASTKPLIEGRWLQPGTHLDLVGSFREDMRESDDEAVSRARLFVDNHESAARSGDLAQPAKAGLIDLMQVEADLAELCQGRHPGRSSDADITLFKSAGMSLEDLAAAELAARHSTS
ncbi:ornithine cyclodeaminase family protein [uncultured Roseovarius sp.]|uniref:ornithine cyclodeaminase family protein n=1 Tax=uncultured Roseovarius sp. TaxID=293344 RepID=UPI00260FBA44|nr:ornithine cyclodeaminase family protein [uncultured Roseovarius sp.]